MSINKTNKDTKSRKVSCELEMSSTVNNNMILSEDPNLDVKFRKNSHSNKILELVSKSILPQDNSIETTCHQKTQQLITNELKTRSISQESNYSHVFGGALFEDFKKITRYYYSDFIDGIVGKSSLSKTVATTIFLYFSILLPTIAFSSLNYTQTNGKMGELKKSILAQAFGGLLFALLSGQPLVIIMTTAPLCLNTKVIYNMCILRDLDFYSIYALVGIWNAIFLAIYALFGLSSSIIKHCSRFVQEIFAFFIVCALISDAFTNVSENFVRNYYSDACSNLSQLSKANGSLPETRFSNESATKQSSTEKDNNPFDEFYECKRETSLLYIILMLATVFIGLRLFDIRKTNFYTKTIRDNISSYSLPIAIAFVSLSSHYVFNDILDRNEDEESLPIGDLKFEIKANFLTVPLIAHVMAAGLGFILSLLFIMDQTISAAMVDAPQYGLKKGTAYHWDLLLVGILNISLTLFGMPMMHGVLPHSPMHARSLADIDELTQDNHKFEIKKLTNNTKRVKNIRETRLTGIMCHILIAASLYLIPKPIALIPTAVLSGLFIYMALTSLDDLQMYDRILLLFTEQSKYPPTEYNLHCPKTKVHLFTSFQLFLLIILCLFGFAPINTLRMLFPILVLLMIPFKKYVVTKFISQEHLSLLDVDNV